MPTRTLVLTLAYDGAAYVGWQRQAAGFSIQGLVEDALARLDGGPVTVVGAGRTDAGVHALGQVARARVRTPLDLPTIQRAMNATLPADIRVVGIAAADAAFHPRFDAVSKTYQYWFWDAPVMPPGVRGWCWHVARALDADAMDAAARTLEGRHDFAAFQSAGSDVTSTARTVTSARVSTVSCSESPAHPLVSRLAPGDGRFIVFEIEADGFLRHMVRAVAGTLVEVGDGRREPGAMASILASAARGHAGATAPAHGLVLVRVRYPGTLTMGGDSSVRGSLRDDAG